VYNGTSDGDDASFALYKKGVTMGCWGLFVYSASSALYACKWKKAQFSFSFFEYFYPSLFGTMVIRKVFFKNTLFSWLFCICNRLCSELFCS
jgi:hypothetical protein